MKTTTITALWQAPLPEKQSGKTSTGQETFEDWLQQDGYYRHHQAQWEASQLRFSATTNKHKPAPEPLQRQAPNAARPVAGCHSPSEQVPMLNRAFSDACPSTQPPQAQEFDHPRQPAPALKTRQPEVALSKTPHSRCCTIIRPTTGPERSFDHRVSPLSNYHLHRKGQSVSLAMALPDTDGNGIRQFLHRLRLWFTSKHFHLTHITINGEQHD
ncbi:MAG: hypothetical protein JJT82_06045 [Legionellaceae bacterium]|nr:hypothetical protein [Legionellaceae bacterium]